MGSDLRISSLRLADFRNYRSFDLEDVSGLTVLIGPNGVGKTNVLEAVQLLCACTSFRHPLTGELVRQGASAARASMVCTDGKRRLDVALGVAEGKKRYELNGKPRRAVDLKGMLPAVTFTPDDLELSKGSSAVKRAALDELGSQITRNYRVLMRDYEKVLRYKGRLLRDEASADLVRSINDTLVTCGAQLTSYRSALFERMQGRMAENYAAISGGREALTCSYVPSWLVSRTEAPDSSGGAGRIEPADARTALEAALDGAFDEERARGRCLMGPHADKIAFFLDGRDVSDYASQGQQRSVVLAFKVAEVQTIEDSLQQKPVLLLDDVMSELDEGRRRALVELVEDDIQTFVTATDLDFFDEGLLSRANVVDLSKQRGD